MPGVATRGAGFPVRIDPRTHRPATFNGIRVNVDGHRTLRCHITPPYAFGTGRVGHPEEWARARHKTARPVPL